MNHCFRFNARPVLECKAQNLQLVNDITGKPTLIASLYLALHDVSKQFETFMPCFSQESYHPLNTRIVLYFKQCITSYLILQNDTE